MQGGSIPTYFISHTITVEKIDTAVDAISEISVNIQRPQTRDRRRKNFSGASLENPVVTTRPADF